MLTGEDICKGEIDFSLMCFNCVFLSFLCFVDTLPACEWKKFNFLTKMDKYNLTALSTAAVSRKVCRFWIYLWSKPVLNTQGVLLWPQNVGLPFLQTELNWLQALEKLEHFFQQFIRSSLISSSLSLLCALRRRRSSEPKRRLTVMLSLKLLERNCRAEYKQRSSGSTNDTESSVEE